MSLVGGIPWNSIGVVTVCLLMCGLIVTGRLVPRSHSEQRIKDLKATMDERVRELTDRNTFLQAHVVSMENVKEELARQNSELLGTSRLATQLLGAIHPQIPQGSGIDGHFPS